jgi:hypothetical protein
MSLLHVLAAVLSSFGSLIGALDPSPSGKELSRSPVETLDYGLFLSLNTSDAADE